MIQIDLAHFKNKRLKAVNQKRNFKCSTMISKMLHSYQLEGKIELPQDLSMSGQIRINKWVAPFK